MDGFYMAHKVDYGRIRHMLLSSLFAPFLIFSLISGCTRNTTPPPDLIGLWSTSDERYVDRYIEITGDSLILGIGEGGTLVHSISNISSGQEGNGIRYTLHYLDQEGLEWTLSMLYSSVEGGTLVLQNRDEVWIKEERP